MGCLDNFIGLRGVCPAGADPESGLYVNDMPMGGLDRLEALSDAETQDFVGLWEKVYGRSVAFFKGDIRKYLPIRVRSNDLLDNVISGDFLDPYTEVGDTAQWRGVFIKVFGSQNMSITIPFLRIHLKLSGNVPVKIWNVLTGELLYSNTFTGVAGENIFYPKLDTATFAGVRKIFVAFDNTNILVADSKTHNLAWCATNGVTDYANFRGAYVTTANPNPLEATLSKTTNSGGLIVAFSLRCDLDRWICQNRMALANALLLKCAIELYREALEGDQLINRYTLVSSEELRKRIEDYTNQYMTELTTVLQSIQITDSVCFECSYPVQPDYQHG